MATNLTPKSAGAPPPPKKASGATPVASAPALGGGNNGRAPSYSGAAKQGAPIPTPSVIKFDDDVDNKRAKKLSRRRQGGSSGRGFFSWLFSVLFKVGVFYMLIGAFWTCGSQPFKFDYNKRDERAHCRTLAQAKAQLQPVLTPYYHAAQAKVDPYTRPYVDAASPYVKQAWKTTRPYYRYANKQGQRYYRSRIEPLRKHAVKRARAYSDPHIKTATAHYNKQVQPHVDNFQRAVKPYKDIYRRDVSPYLDEAYRQSLVFGSASYAAYVSRVHPVVVRFSKKLHRFYTNYFDPAVRRAYALYIRPQVNKALEKVFGHRARALGSDALREAKQDVKQVQQDAKTQRAERVAEAKASASRAVEDPTLVDRLNIAKDHVTGGPLAAADPVASAAADAELQVEQSSVKEQLEAWEKGLAHLIDEEYKLALGRITEIRTRFSDSLPDRFNILTEDVETEVEGIFARLLKTFGKLNAEAASTSVDDRVRSGKSAIDKQRAKLERSRSKTVGNLESLDAELSQEEAVAQQASVDEVKRYIAEAQKSYRSIMGSAKFPQTAEEWSGWDSGLAVRSELFSEELDEVRSGSRKVARGVVGIDPGHRGDVQRQVSKLIKQIETLYDTALAELGSFSAKELSALGGAGAAAAAGAVLESVAEGAKKLTGDAREVLEDAASSLSGGAGSGAAAILASKASEASASASSLAREGAKSAGIPVQPETPGEYVESVASQAASVASDAGASASSIARQGAKSAGIPVSPETPGEYVENAGEYVENAASQVVSAVSDRAASASSIARQGAKSAGIPVSPETPGEYIESIASQASSAASDGAASASSVARQGAKSAGIPVSPETPGEYIESVASQASSVAADGAASASSVARQGAKSAGIPVSPETPGEYIESVASQVSSVASDGAASASSVARQGAKSAGIPVSPERPDEYVSSLASQASSGLPPVSSLTSRAGDAAAYVASGASEFAAAAQTGLSVDAAQVASSASSVARRAAKSAGASVRPESPSEYAEAAAGLAVDGAAMAAGEVSSAVHHASRSVASAAGAQVTPETPDEWIEAVIPDGASSLASSASEAGEAAGETLSSFVAHDASSALHHATRWAASAAGVAQSPESVSEYVEAVGDAAQSVYSKVRDEL